jgi:uncharacterized membrane protein
MKKYFKLGIGTIVPIALVVMVLNWIYDLVNDIVIVILPKTINYEWWFVFPFIFIVVIIIFLIGIVFSFIRPLKWAKNKFESQVINRIPYIKGVYKFGTEIVDSFVTDVNDDGDLQVIEISFGEFKLLGVLTDEKNNVGFLISAPSPLTGIVIKLPNYRKLDMTFMEAVKINTSLGKIGTDKWR